VNLDHHQDGVIGNQITLTMHPARKDINICVVIVTTDRVPENPK